MMKYVKWWNIIKLGSSLCVLTTLLTLYMHILPKNGIISHGFNHRIQDTAVKLTKKAEGVSFNTQMLSSGHKQNKDEIYRAGLTASTKPGSSDSIPTKPRREGPLNVVIVEEHHEVIPYWFGAADRGIISKTGNTLIHIDGHNDLGPPLYLPGYPFFRWPKTILELRYFMQRNDAFIQASAMAGLISHSVWVWPEWDRVNHVADYVTANLSLGWFQVNDGEEKAFCMCEYNNTEFKCFTIHDADNENKTMPYDGFPVQPHRCTIEKTILVEEIAESMATQLFIEESWVENIGNIILDIDEDYFGCTYAIRPLLDVGIKMDTLEKLDKVVSTIFCPLRYEQEKVSTIVLQELIQSVLDILCPSRVYSSVQCNNNTKHFNKTDLSQKVRHILEREIHSYSIRLCIGIYQQLNHLVTDLVRIIISLKVRQLEQLRIVSFCLETSPRTLIPDEARHFGVCFGANKPNDSVVLEHRPSVPEIRHRSSILNNILHNLAPLSPQLASVCRSVRDGYTPREHAMFIEKLVLKGLQHELSTETSVNYDKGLLGGEHGWYKSTKHAKR